MPRANWIASSPPSRNEEEGEQPRAFSSLIKPKLNPNQETMNAIKVLLFTVVSLTLSSFALATEEPKPEALPAGQNMYVIERIIPGAAKMSAEELKAVSQKSCAVLRNLGPQI